MVYGSFFPAAILTRQKLKMQWSQSSRLTHVISNAFMSKAGFGHPSRHSCHGGQPDTLKKAGMQLFCLQLEASCLQWSLFTYHWGRNYYRLNLKPILQCKINHITDKLIWEQLCNVIRFPHGMPCSNARNYITEEIIPNQFCKGSEFEIITLCNVIILAQWYSYVLGASLLTIGALLLIILAFCWQL